MRVARGSRAAERDAQDSRRPVAPLRRAPDAVLLDTTDLGFEEQVGAIVRLITDRLHLPAAEPHSE